MLRWLSASLVVSMRREAQLGEDGEDAVDGSHPTDLGFLRQAEALVEILAPILRGASL